MYLVSSLIAGAIVGCAIVAFWPVNPAVAVAATSVGGAMGVVLEAMARLRSQ
jgi:hypothetical protein